MAAEVFVAYAHRDEALRNELEVHLAVLKSEGLINLWHDRRIEAGTEWEGEIDEHLESAPVILLLVSPDFLASKYCYGREAARALERHKAGTARVIPVVLRPCQWERTPISGLQALPTDARPVTRWEDVDEAWLNVANGIAEALEEVESDAPTGSTSAVRGDENYSPTGLVVLRMNSIRRMSMPPNTLFLVAPDYAIEQQSFIVCVLETTNNRFLMTTETILSVEGGYFAPLDMNTYESGPQTLRFPAGMDRIVAKIYGSADEIVVTAEAAGYSTQRAVVQVAKSDPAPRLAVTPNVPWALRLNAVVVQGSAPVAEVATSVESESGMLVAGVFVYSAGAWRFYFPARPDLDGGLAQFPGPIAAAFICLVQPTATAEEQLAEAGRSLQFLYEDVERRKREGQ